MIILGYCPGCKGKKFPEDKPHRSLVLKKRIYYTKHAGVIKGKKETCGRCHRNTIRALGKELK